MATILIVRSSTVLFTKLVKEFSAEELSAVIASPMDAEDREYIDDAHTIMLPEENGFRFWHLAWYFWHMREKQFDEVICLYNNKTGFGYLNVDLFAMAVRARKRIAYNYDREKIALTWRYLGTKCMHSFVGIMWLGINSLVSVFLFSAIALGMVFVECCILIRICIDRLFGKKSNRRSS